ncbi:MAG: glycosyltransferase family 2 protein [bacterium]
MEENSTKNLISVIVPVFNSGWIITDCLNSLLNQTYKNWEIIVVNDGSTDNSVEILNTFSDRVKIINQKNSGANSARNRGLKEARGDFLLFSDSDIIWQTDALEKLFSALENNPDKSYAYSSFKFGCKRFKLWKFDANKLKTVNYIHSSSLVRREHFPGWDESIKRLQDWDVWLTMLEQNYTGIWVPEILFVSKTKNNSISSWLPSFFYKIPFAKLGLKNPQKIADYKKAEQIVKAKHNL